MGRQVGAIFGTFGGQDRPRSVQNASWKLINMKNVNFHEILRPLIRERKLGRQDGLQNAPRSAQDGPKRVLERNFFALENRLNFGLVLDPMLIDFGLPKPLLHVASVVSLGVLKLVFFRMMFLCCFGSAPRRPKRRPSGPKTPPRAPQEAPRGRQERPRRLPEGLRRPQEPPKRAQDLPRSSKRL